jgi:hypothetical protein
MRVPKPAPLLNKKTETQKLDTMNIESIARRSRVSIAKVPAAPM